MIVPFCGPSYWINDRRAEVQRLVNMYTATAYDQSKGRPVRLEPIPGLTPFEAAAVGGWDPENVQGAVTVTGGGYLANMLPPSEG